MPNKNPLSTRRIRSAAHTLKNTDSSLHQPAEPGWQLLGEIVFLNRSGAGTIRTWFSQLLNPLNLQSDFTIQLLNSAQDAMMRALHSNPKEPFGNVHFSVFVLDGHTLADAWGFFRIEKLDSVEPDKEHLEHAVEFYLYVERQ